MIKHYSNASVLEDRNRLLVNGPFALSHNRSKSHGHVILGLIFHDKRHVFSLIVFWDEVAQSSRALGSQSQGPGFDFH